MGPGMSKLGFEKQDNVLFFLHDGVNILGGLQSKKVVSKISLIKNMHLKKIIFLVFHINLDGVELRY